MLSAIAAAFLLLSLVSASVSLPDDDAHATETRSWLAVAVVSAIAAVVIFGWAAVRVRAHISGLFRVRLCCSRRRLVVHLLLVVVAAAGTHAVLLHRVSDYFVDELNQHRQKGYLRVPLPQSSWNAGRLRNLAAGGTWRGIDVYPQPPEDFTGPSQGYEYSHTCNDWYTEHSLKVAFRAMIADAARAGWPEPALRNQVEAAAAKAAELDALPPLTFSEVRKAVKRLPALGIRGPDDAEGFSDCELYLTDSGAAVPLFLFWSQVEALRVQVDGPKLWLRVRADEEITVLVDTQRQFSIELAYPKTGEEGGRTTHVMHRFHSLAACLGAIAIPWAVFFAPFCYLTRRRAA
ncbi:MAG: hypothetical protein NTW87_24475 [Planctomycetota bacterium]|nr:hypothetical protein [Planctomycetota bacterium]